MSKPKIVILDGYTTNPGDLTWGAIGALGDLAVYDRTSDSDIAERAGEADIVLSNKIIWSEENLRSIPACRMIQLLSTGYNVVDFDVAGKRGITVCNVPAYSTPDVAQHAFALILSTTNHVNDYAQSVRLGNWVTAKDFTYYVDPLMELQRKTLGIVGMGSTGQAVAHLGQAFGMKVLFQGPHGKPELESDTCHQVDLDELLAKSDVVSLHCPSTPETAGMVNAEFLAKMKKGSRLINTARGALICSADVADALSSGYLAYYAADVAESEPMAPDDPLRLAPHAIITPHVAWATVEARGRLVAQAAANVAAYLEGAPINVVGPVGGACSSCCISPGGAPSIVSGGPLENS